VTTPNGWDGRPRSTTRGSWDGAVPCRVTAQLEERWRSFTIDLTAGSSRQGLDC
jgi:hypothetical protein